LIGRLGIKPGMRLHFAGAPPGYPRLLGNLPTVVQLIRLKAPADFIQYFATSRAQLEAKFGTYADALAPDGMLWITWPSDAAKIDTDLTGDVVRAIGLAHGLVDVKVCAVGDVWSGLKFVRRRTARPSR